MLEANHAIQSTFMRACQVPAAGLDACISQRVMEPKYYMAHGLASSLCTDNRNLSSTDLIAHEEGLPEPVRREGETIAFHRVALNAPDGTLLVRELTFEVPRGRSCLIMGPNGAPPLPDAG